MGSPLPVRRWRSQARRPSGVPSSALAQRRDSLDDPLLAFGPPTRYVPAVPPAVSRRRAPLLGFLPLQRSRRRESTPPRIAPRSSPVPRDPRPGPTLAGTLPLAGFHNLSAAFFLSPPSHHFQMGDARGVLPSGGCASRRSPGDSSPPACPLDVVPVTCASPFLGGVVTGARAVA